MGKNVYSDLRALLSTSQEQWASLLGIHRVTWARVETNKGSLPADADARFAQISGLIEGNHGPILPDAVSEEGVVEARRWLIQRMEAWNVRILLIEKELTELDAHEALALRAVTRLKDTELHKKVLQAPLPQVWLRLTIDRMNEKRRKWSLKRKCALLIEKDSLATSIATATTLLESLEG